MKALLTCIIIAALVILLPWIVILLPIILLFMPFVLPFLIIGLVIGIKHRKKDD